MNTKTITKPYAAPTRESEQGYSFAPVLKAQATTLVGTGIFLASLLLFVTALSVAVLSKESIRLDEAQSLWQTGRSVPGLLAAVAEDVHVPLYHLLLHAWRLFAGESIEAARFLSLLFFLGSIPLIYHLGRETYGRSVGMFAAFLLALSPFMNWYGSEARMYSLLAFLALLNQLFFVRTFQKPDRAAWIGYALSAAAGMLTHYFFAFALVAQAIFFFLKKDAFAPGSLRKFILSAAVIALAVLPWLAYVFTLGAASNTRPLLYPPSSVDFFNVYSEMLFGFQTDHLNTVIVSLWPLTVLLGFFALRRNRRLSAETLYFIIAMTVPIVAAFGLSFVVRPFFLARYLILSLPALYLFLGWLFATYPPRLGFALKTALIAAMFLGLAVQTLSAQTPVKEEYQAAVAYLNRAVRPQDIVILSAPFTIYPIEYYYTGTAAIGTLPIWNRFEHGPIPPFIEANLGAEVEQLKGKHRKAYLLLSYDQGYEETVRQYFASRFEQLEHRRYSRGLSLYVYKLRYDETEIAAAVNALFPAP